MLHFACSYLTMFLSLLSLLVAADAAAASFRIGSFVSLAGLTNPAYKNKLCVVVGEPFNDKKEVRRVAVSCIKGDYYDANSEVELKDIEVPVESLSQPDWDDVTQVRVVDLGFKVNGIPFSFPKDAMMNESDKATINRLTQALPWPVTYDSKVISHAIHGPLRNKLRLIGAVIFQLYGHEGMLIGHDFQSGERGRLVARSIESLWDGIGQWMS